MNYSWQPDAIAYKKCMEEIKKRLEAVKLVGMEQYSTPYKITNVEFMALQLRKVFEMIVLASIASHKSAVPAAKKKIGKEWDINKIIQQVRKLNPNFYPRPIKRVPSDKPGIKDEWVDTDKEFLALPELIKAHGQLHELLHA